MAWGHFLVSRRGAGGATALHSQAAPMQIPLSDARARRPIHAVRRHLGYRSEYRSPFSSGDILIFGLAYKSSLFEKFSICADGALGLGQPSLLYNGILPKDTNMESISNSGARPTCSALPHANRAPRRGNSCTSTVRPVSF
jgi:hypothetical protein